jgi:hypothetical protein
MGISLIPTLLRLGPMLKMNSTVGVSTLNATLSSLVLEPPDCRRLERSEDEEKELADIVVWMAL